MDRGSGNSCDRSWVIQFVGATCPYADEAQRATPCDVLAWSPHDPSSLDGRLKSGYQKADVPAAIAACEAALADQPENARLQYRYGLTLWRANRHDEAVPWLRKSADQGYSAAQADLAHALREDVAASGHRSKAEAAAKAFRLSRLASEQGNIIAMGDLGYCYMSGTGVERDYDQALKWLRQAVEHDDLYAESHLGEMYKSGWGVPRDDVEAVKWFRRSSDQGYRGGQYNLALMLLEGRGIARDRAAAEELLSRAADQEHRDARRELQKLRTAPQQ
jgi:TPR repeat protein